MNGVLALAIACWPVGGGHGVAIFDSGDPIARPDGEIPLISVWKVLDAGDNLATRVIAPFELTEPTTITAFSFFAFSPKDPAFKRIELFSDVTPESPGTPLTTIEFRNHEGAQQGWTRFDLEQPVRLAAGHYGVAYHGNREFATFWAANAPIGEGYVWARPNEQANWAKVADARYGFTPNFAMRIFGATRIGGSGDAGSDDDGSSGIDEDGIGDVTPVGGAIEAAPAGTRPTPAPAEYKYPRGRSPGTFHIVWRNGG